MAGVSASYVHFASVNLCPLRILYSILSLPVSLSSTHSPWLEAVRSITRLSDSCPDKKIYAKPWSLPPLRLTLYDIYRLAV